MLIDLCLQQDCQCSKKIKLNSRCISSNTTSQVNVFWCILYCKYTEKQSDLHLQNQMLKVQSVCALTSLLPLVVWREKAEQTEHRRRGLGWVLLELSVYPFTWSSLNLTALLLFTSVHWKCIKRMDGQWIACRIVGLFGQLG